MDQKFCRPLPRGLTTNAMPIEFSDADQETNVCFNSAALFDFSFILRLVVSGRDANKALTAFSGRNFSELRTGEIRYAVHADDNGHLLSDLTVWRLGSDRFDLMTGRAEDFSNLQDSITPLNASVSDLSAETAIFAVQGPLTDEVLTEIGFDPDIRKIPYFNFCDICLMGQYFKVGRLGFTGLPGVEILCPLQQAPYLWDKLSRKIRPAGLMAADRIRLNAGFALFTHEFLPKVTATDAGLSRLRPFGNTLGDRAPAKVFRVIFSARIIEDLDFGHWSGCQDFPPDPNTLAVTSAVKTFDPGYVLGMGYLQIGSYGAEYDEPTGMFKNISIVRRF